ncbi:hypothetical protein AO377_1330 [Moraxella catarrhalis]|nr:hypothetical protein AO377_1330 [Moraxella catarrhalis]
MRVSKTCNIFINEQCNKPKIDKSEFSSYINRNFLKNNSIILQNIIGWL